MAAGSPASASIAAIDATPKGQYIRIAAYSFDRESVAAALIRAAHRGVHVQMLLNDHQYTAAMRNVRAVIGADRTRKSFIYRCKSSCRGASKNRNLHSKFYLFTRAGRSRDVIMVGSANMTLNAVRHQWNDLYLFSGDAPIFTQFVALFDDMKIDYSTQQPSYEFCGIPTNGKTCDDSVDKYTAVVFPRYSGPHHDVVLDILNKIQCITVLPDGTRQRTRLALSMHTMRGNRGDYLAAAIRRKYAEGCNFRVNYGLIGFYTKQILGTPTRRGRIPLRSTGFDFNGDGLVDRYTHQKYFVIRGNYDGEPNTDLTFTGSQNWSGLATGNDEILFSILGRRVARRYMVNFNFMWRPGNSRNAYTTTFQHFGNGNEGRVATGVSGLLRAGGANWEGD